MNIIEFEDICLKIGSSEILSNVTFDVQKGDIFCLVGNNGAGKSSLICILLGLTTSYTGKERISLSSDLCKSRERIGSVIDSLKVNTHTSVQKDIFMIFAGYMAYLQDRAVKYSIRSGWQTSAENISCIIHWE